MADEGKREDCGSERRNRAGGLLERRSGHWNGDGLPDGTDLIVAVAEAAAWRIFFSWLANPDPEPNTEVCQAAARLRPRQIPRNPGEPPDTPAHVGDHEIPQVGGVGDHVIPHPAIT